MPSLLLFASLLLPTSDDQGEFSPRVRVVRATYRLEHPKTSGTGFLLQRATPPGSKEPSLLLVTAAHAFEKMNTDRATLVLRTRNEEGGWDAAPTEIPIRQGMKKRWRRHPKVDVAALPLSLPEEVAVESLPVSMLATESDWEESQLEPGSLVWSIGFPHASLFKPSKAAFPLTRLGCIASYPLHPPEDHRTFLVDYNSFEGDSGGPITAELVSGGISQLKIIGLVHGQHFIDEKYKLVYAEGKLRKRLGLATVTHSKAILETIAMPK
ncbi:hypothetical protein Pan216_38450 [Planctomycetes bacterium Pan216]|uniref:Trypsin n=1 Tax=Kolteria novifilia TaxID=2527975 RepID=A0A518B7N1_9BACT|nr:hypothetical protein Pan216_38450 [Planctomycetes bacterium Pan216]